MIFPLRHDQDEVRRWPWVSGAIMLICVLAFLFTDTSGLEQLPDTGDYVEQATDYWRNHAYLKADPVILTEVGYDVMPNQRKQYIALMIDQSYSFMPDDPADVAAEQAELDSLTAYALGQVAPPEIEGASNPYARWGYVPERNNWLGLFTSIFMHAGWLHLIGNLFMFFLVGPAIEDRLGRPLFGVFFLLAGAFAALFHGLITQQPLIPLVGASGAIAGAMGAFLIRFWQAKIKFAYFFLILLRPIYGTFEAQALFMLPLWFATEILKAWWDHSTGMASGIAYGAHIGGFAFGAAVMAAVRFFKVEERFIDAKIEDKITYFKANPAVEEAAVMRANGNDDEAWARLNKGREDSPDDASICLALWDMALATPREAEAAPAMAHAVERTAHVGELELAAQYWCELTNAVPSVRCDANTLIRIVPELQKDPQNPEFAIRALRHTVDPENDSLTPSLALRALDLAREFDPPSALLAAERALESTEMHDAKRASVEEQIAAWKAEGVVAPSPGETTSTPPSTDHQVAPASEFGDPDPNAIMEAGLVDLEAISAEAVPEEPAPASATSAADPDDVSDSELDGFDLSALSDLGSDIGSGARWNDVKASEGKPIALDESALRLELSGERTARLELTKIQAIAVGVVSGLGPKPTLLIDLVLNWSAIGDVQLRIVRLRSSQFNPRRIISGEKDPMRALQIFLERLSGASQTAALPDATALAGKPFPRFDSLEAYEREVLDVDR